MKTFNTIHQQANDLKAKGNKSLLDGDYAKAVQFYSEAIELCPKNHVLFSNRSAAFAKQEKYSEALLDAKKTVELNQSWCKVTSTKFYLLVCQLKSLPMS